jgi:hypothetical protein
MRLMENGWPGWAARGGDIENARLRDRDTCAAGDNLGLSFLRFEIRNGMEIILYSGVFD